MNLALQTLVSTVVQGSILALITIGMSLVYGTLRVLTMAQGVMVMVGGMAAFGLVGLFLGPIVLYTLRELVAILRRDVYAVASV